jgi:hypothetical protein
MIFSRQASLPDYLTPPNSSIGLQRWFLKSWSQGVVLATSMATITDKVAVTTEDAEVARENLVAEVKVEVKAGAETEVKVEAEAEAKAEAKAEGEAEVKAEGEGEQEEAEAEVTITINLAAVLTYKVLTAKSKADVVFTSMWLLGGIFFSGAAVIALLALGVALEWPHCFHENSHDSCSTGQVCVSYPEPGIGLPDYRNGHEGFQEPVCQDCYWFAKVSPLPRTRPNCPCTLASPQLYLHAPTPRTPSFTSTTTILTPLLADQRHHLFARRFAAHRSGARRHALRHGGQHDRLRVLFGGTQRARQCFRIRNIASTSRDQPTVSFARCPWTQVFIRQVPLHPGDARKRVGPRLVHIVGRLRARRAVHGRRPAPAAAHVPPAPHSPPAAASPQEEGDG